MNQNDALAGWSSDEIYVVKRGIQKKWSPKIIGTVLANKNESQVEFLISSDTFKELLVQEKQHEAANVSFSNCYYLCATIVILFLVSLFELSLSNC